MKASFAPIDERFVTREAGALAAARRAALDCRLRGSA
jgi:hypothetical protein